MKAYPTDFLYDVRQYELDAFGERYIGPKTFRYGEEVAVAVFKKPPHGGDGQEVHIYCTAMPARFYRIHALATPNSVGKTSEGFSLSTGSGENALRLSVDIAKAIADGMLGLTDAQS